MFLKLTIGGLLGIFYAIYIVLSVVTIILERKRPEKTIAWVLVFMLLPPLGLILYIFLGRNWKKHRLNYEFSPYVRDLINRVISKIENPEYIPIIQLLANNSDSPLFIHNDITIFEDGEKKFEALIRELKKAKHHIHIEYYIVKNDKIGNEIKDILVSKAKSGVQVRFIIDRVGSIGLSKKYKRELKEAGVDLAEYSYFLAPILRFINTQINYRNHRKIVVIDGKVGFVGGMNIGDEYLGKGKLGFWRDTHLMIKGDFVLGLQGVFIDDFWSIKRANAEYAVYDREFDKYFPTSKSGNNKAMQLVTSGPDSELQSIMHSFLKMITMAKKNIYITTPYFVPPEAIMESLKVAALGGIDVKIIFPGKYDHFMVYYASRSYLAELIKCGVKVYLYKDDSFVHSKVMTIDGEIATVGTANMDIRSFELNYEINSVIYDKEITEKLDGLFFHDLEGCTEMTAESYENTSRWVKLTEAFARMFSTLL